MCKKESVIDLRKVTDCCSRISDEFFYKHIKLYPVVQFGEDELDIRLTDEGKLIYRDNILEKFNDKLSGKLAADPVFSYRLTHEVSILEKKMYTDFHEYDYKFDNYYDIEWDLVHRMFYTVCRFAAFRISRSFSYEFLNECIRDITENDMELTSDLMCKLQIPDCMTYYSFYHYNLYLFAYLYRKSNSKAQLIKFINKAAFLGTRTVIPAYNEDINNLINTCNTLYQSYSEDELLSMSKTIVNEHRKSRLKKAAALNYIAMRKNSCKMFASDQFMALCYLSGFIATFEERKHYWRMRLFKNFRKMAMNLDLDPLTTSLQDIKSRLVQEFII